MANGKITKDQIADKDVLDNIGNSADINDSKLKALKTTMDSVIETAKRMKSGASGEDPKNNKTIKERNELLKT